MRERASDCDRIAAQVAERGMIPTGELVAWMRREGWTRGQGEQDLAALRREGRVERVGTWGATTYRAVAP